MITKRLQVKRKDTGYRPPQVDALNEIMTEEDKVRLNVEISKSKRQALKAKAAMEGRTVQEIINDLVEGYLNK